ncbi:MAG: response regulator, partial [Candidatus Brocadiales bacterium]
ISDIFMPKMDGFDLCRAVKNDERLKTTAFVFYTAAYTGVREEVLGMQLGASRFIIKPMDAEEFLVEIEKVLKEHKEGKLSVPEQPKLGEEELERMHDKIQLEKLKERVKELEREKKALEESEE